MRDDNEYRLNPIIMTKLTCAPLFCGRLLSACFLLCLALPALAGEEVKIDGHRWDARPLAQDDFSNDDWKSRWSLEGNATVTTRSGALEVVTAASKEVEQAATLWWNEALPQNVMVEFQAEVLPPVEDNAANVNLFLHARESDGRPYQAGRSGRYGDYHKLPNYIATLTGGFQEGWARLRRNPGFNLVSEDKGLRSEVGGQYRIRLLAANGRLLYWVNDRLVHDVTDPEPLPGGHFALRTWRSRIAFSKVRFYSLHRIPNASEPVRVKDRLAEVGLEYIDTSFENASPLWYEADDDGTVVIHLLYDQERESPNRAAGHFHFQLQGRPGATLNLEFRDIFNVWNGVRSSNTSRILLAVVSEDGRNWTPVPLEPLPGDRVRLTVTMPGPRLYVARAEPYRLSDLERWLDSIRQHPLVQITPIGNTVQGRELEIVRVGKPTAPHHVFIRARAHPWEPVGNWVVQGLVSRLLSGDADAQRFLERYYVSILPMANKDGVVDGRTRFNRRGRDLNRNLNRPADPENEPENLALERWIEAQIKEGKTPDLALELHNDAGGRLQLARVPVPGLPRYLRRMVRFESLLREHTWFTEGTTPPSFSNTGALGSGWLERYGIEGVTHEFNANWIAGLKAYPTGKHWEAYGAGLAAALEEYFGDGWTEASLQPWLKSSFETGVRIAYDEPTRQLDRLVGTDAVTGFDWERDVPAPRANFFNLVRNQKPSDYVRTELVEVTGREGTPTRALRMEVTAKDPALTSPGQLNRNEFSLFKPDYSQAYARYWLKLQDNYLEVAPRDHAKSWRMFFEVKEPNSGVKRQYAPGNRHTGTNNYRMSCYIRRKPDGQLYWHVRGEAPQPIRTVDWDIFNDEVPVPVGRWFQVEVFFNHAEDGAFWLAVDGQQVAYRRGRTQHPDNPLPISFWSPFKLYHGLEWFATGPTYQLIDDVEFWPDFPPDATPRDESRANQSTFQPPIADSPAASSPSSAIR